MPKTIDIAGKRFGRLVAIEPTKGRRDGSVVWKCKCDCGNVAYASSGNIVKGNVNSCGCLFKEKNIEKLNAIRKDVSIQEKRKNSLGYHDGTMEKMLSDKPTNANKTGVRGVTYNNITGKYRAMIRYKRKLYHIGCFDTLKEAKEARKIAEKEIWGKDV